MRERLAPRFTSGESAKGQQVATDFPNLTRTEELRTAGANRPVAERNPNVGSPAGSTIIERLVQHAEYSTVPLETARAPGPAAIDDNIKMPSLDPHDDLRVIRNNFPFVPIMPFPPIVRSIFIPTASVRAYELIVPSQATLCMLTGDGLFYVCSEGNAEIPTATNSPEGGGDNTSKSFAIPPNAIFPFVFYVRGRRSLSVICASAPTNPVTITAMFWNTDMWLPRHGN